MDRGIPVAYEDRLGHPVPKRTRNRTDRGIPVVYEGIVRITWDILSLED